MQSFIREPVQRHLLSLVLVLLVIGVFLISVNILLDKNTRQLSSSIDNQSARKDIGLVINQRLSDSKILMYKLLDLGDLRDLSAIRRDMEENHLVLLSALNVLQNGGVLKEEIPVNVEEQEILKREIRYSKNAQSPYVPEVLELTPKILRLEQHLSVLSQLAEQRISGNGGEADGISERIDGLLQWLS